jgi:hypothetical protein
MDNFSLDVTAWTQEQLEQVLAMVLSSGPFRETFRGFRVFQKGEKLCHLSQESVVVPTLVLFTSLPEKASSNELLLVPLCPRRMAEDAAQWIASIDLAKYAKGPDIDGDVRKGFRAFTPHSRENYVDHHPGIVAIRPAWAMFGK